MTEKPALYLLPGLLCDETVWSHQVQHLADVATVTVPDYRDCDAIPWAEGWRWRSCARRPNA